MRSLRFVLVLVSVVLVSGLNGQEKDEPAKIKGTLPANYKKLGLSADQVQQIYRLQARIDAQIAELNAKIDALKKSKEAEREKVLTAAQRTKLKEIRLGEDKKPTTTPDKKPTSDTIKKPTEAPKKP